MRKKQVFFLLLCFIAGIFLLAEFFHTETTIELIDLCPIGIWEMNTIATTFIYFLIIVFLATLIYIIPLDTLYYIFFEVTTVFRNKSPPVSEPLSYIKRFQNFKTGGISEKII
jgi:hypothetical protein